MANTVAEANLATKLLTRFSKLNLQGAHQLLRAKRIVDRRQRRQVHHQQTELAFTPAFRNQREARFQPRISATKRDARAHELRVSAPKREVHVQPQAMPKREICISLQERETHVHPKAAPEHDHSVSILKCESH